MMLVSVSPLMFSPAAPPFYVPFVACHFVAEYALSRCRHQTIRLCRLALRHYARCARDDGARCKRCARQCNACRSMRRRTRESSAAQPRYWRLITTSNPLLRRRLLVDVPHYLMTFIAATPTPAIYHHFDITRITPPTLFFETNARLRLRAMFQRAHERLQQRGKRRWRYGGARK